MIPQGLLDQGPVVSEPVFGFPVYINRLALCVRDDDPLIELGAGFFKQEICLCRIEELVIERFFLDPGKARF